MRLRDVLTSVADRMVADFKASGVAKHRGSKGTVQEAQLFSNYLRKYLPRTVHAEHSGEVVAVNGEVSQQCDIIIVDPSTPPFWDEAKRQELVRRTTPTSPVLSVLGETLNTLRDERRAVGVHCHGVS